MYKYFAYMHVCAYISGAYRGQSKASYFLELELEHTVELQMMTSHHVSAKNRTQFLCKRNQCS